tara:strand:+ start:1103 stop:1858 length:756 start_codon:yes stop_codon:yes gene_type:complete
MAENEFKFPSEVIDLPTGGKMYPKDHPLRDGKIEIKYMTAKEEDILTSANLIKRGVVVDTLLNSLILTKGVKSDDLFIGDKNAVMVAARILAYGPEYAGTVMDPMTAEDVEVTFNLADCPFKKVDDDVDYSSPEFEVELPVSKMNVIFKLPTGREEKLIEKEIAALSKAGKSADITTRMFHIITSINGETDTSTRRELVQNMLAKDSHFLRSEIRRISPDLDLTQNVDIGGTVVEVDIPLTTEFFWPKTRK